MIGQAYDVALVRSDLEKLRAAGFRVSLPSVGRRVKVPAARRLNGGVLVDRLGELSKRDRVYVIKGLIGLVVAEYGVSAEAPYSRARNGVLPEMRQMCAMILRECAGLKFGEISGVLRQSSYSTSSHAVNNLHEKLSVDSRALGIWKKLKEQGDCFVAQWVKKGAGVEDE